MDKPVVIVAVQDIEETTLADALEERYETVVVGEPDAALEAVRTRGPAAVILEFPFPTADGRCLSQVLARDPTAAGIPVIAHSDWDYPRTRATAKEYGCAAFVPRSAPTQDLIAVLDDLALTAASAV